MSAAATTFVIVSAVIMVTSLVVTTTTMMSTTACQMLDQVLNLFFCGIAILDYDTCEVQQLACQRVVGINGYAVFLNLHHLRHKLMILIVHQGDGGAFKDVLVIEVTIDRKYLTIHLVLAFWHIFAKSIFWLKGEVEVSALLQTAYLLLEFVE